MNNAGPGEALKHGTMPAPTAGGGIKLEAMPGLGEYDN